MSRNVLTPEPSRWRRAVVATTVAAGAIACAMTLGDAPAGPDDVVEAFYDDLDFRRIRAAHDRLDPVTRPGFVQFELERSIEDGLVATYAKLDSIRTEIVERDGLHATVRVELDYVTALDGHRRTVTHRLVNRDGEWFIEPNTPDLAIPPAQFVRRADVDFLSQGRRRATTGTTAYADVIDRPEVVTTQARLVRFDQRWVVVGEIVNTDVDPADVTVTAQLLASDGRVLAQYDASQVIAHKLLPKESTPFLIEFEGIAGALDVLDPTAGDFDPAARTPLEIVDADVASFSVYTKAVVTGRDLDRSLVAQDVRIEREGDAWWLVGSLRNDGPETVTIPHLLVGHRNRDAELLWVDHAFVDEAIRPQRSQPFRIGLSDLDGWSDSALPGATFDNGLGSEPATSMLHRLDVDHPIVDHLTVSVIGFVRVTT